MLRLTPAQQQAADGLLTALPTGCAFALSAKPGMGRTTVLRHIHATLGGAILGLREILKELMQRSPFALEEALLSAVEHGLHDQDIVIVDDLHLIDSVTESCDYPRTRLLNAVLTALLDDAAQSGKKIVLGLRKDEDPGPAVSRRACVIDLADFAAEDYECILRAHLAPEAARLVDGGQLHGFAPLLTAWQLRNACSALAHHSDLDAERFISYFREQDVVRSVEIDEVQAIDWKDLKGMDDVIAALEAKIALPFENRNLARKLGLRPRRGVLLAGPPGTGKTTIGRALAHRLRGKFFLIDGTVVANTSDFYRTVRRTFAAAISNAPSVIFIDDTDLIFEGHGDSGFYRYLATMLDGLESASAERVCVMMTAMDPGSLPPALLRSGRVELWLETRLPDSVARHAIIGERLASLPPPIGAADAAVLATASHGLTGADLKSIVEDGKLSFANDVASGRVPGPVDEYFLQAIETVRTNRRNYSKRKPAVFSEAARIGYVV